MGPVGPTWARLCILKHGPVKVNPFSPIQVPAHLSCISEKQGESHCFQFQHTVLKFRRVTHKERLNIAMHFQTEVHRSVCDLADQSWALKAESWMQCWDWKSWYRFVLVATVKHKVLSIVYFLDIINIIIFWCNSWRVPLWEIWVALPGFKIASSFPCPLPTWDFSHCQCLCGDNSALNKSIQRMIIMQNFVHKN